MTCSYAIGDKVIFIKGGVVVDRGVVDTIVNDIIWVNWATDGRKMFFASDERFQKEARIFNPDTMNVELMEILDILVEEASEVIQIAQKIKRFGLASYNPDDPMKLTNQELLERELGDMGCMVDLLAGRGIISHSIIRANARRKREKLKKYSNISGL